MSAASRRLGLGDWVMTDYNGSGWGGGSRALTRHRITHVDRSRRHGVSQSGVLFKVYPLLKHGTPDSWYDADWFEPAEPSPQTELTQP